MILRVVTCTGNTLDNGSALQDTCSILVSRDRAVATANLDSGADGGEFVAVHVSSMAGIGLGVKHCVHLYCNVYVTVA